MNVDGTFGIIEEDAQRQNSQGRVRGEEGGLFFDGAVHNGTAFLGGDVSVDGMAGMLEQRFVGSSQHYAAPPSKMVHISGLSAEVDREDVVPYFRKYGPIESCVVVKDRHGMSMGEAYIVFESMEDACSALHGGALGTGPNGNSFSEHYIYGKSCIVTYGIMPTVKSDGTNRIFVARIPASVSQLEFRAYFEAFGVIKDAYMPKDSNKLGHRGIGFVTYAHASSVERVMMCKHSLGGNELAIDRANPKDKATSGRMHTAMSQPNLSSVAGMKNIFHSSTHTPSPNDASRSRDALTGSATTNNSNSLYNSLLRGQSLGGTGSFLQSTDNLLHGSSPSTMHRTSSRNLGLPLPNVASNPFLNTQMMPYLFSQEANTGSSYDVMHMPTSPGSNTSASYFGSSNHSLDLLQNSSHHGGSNSQHGPPGHGGVPGGGNGPRVFVGKLSRETTDVDLKTYFSQFGYVLDVYVPRDKTNKREHRGFGFVTFETDAAISRIQSQGPHIIHGVTVSIESAVPRGKNAPLPAAHMASF